MISKNEFVVKIFGISSVCIKRVDLQVHLTPPHPSDTLFRCSCLKRRSLDSLLDEGKCDQNFYDFSIDIPHLYVLLK